MVNPIDLGQDNSLPDAPAPSEPTFPTLHLSGGPELHKLPMSGKAIIHHKVMSKSFDQKGKKKRHSVTLQVRKIQPMSSPKRSSHAKDEEAMSELMAKDSDLS